MNEYLFYTFEGYTEGPNVDYPVENCQILGRVKGNNPQEALKNLLKENVWITKAGFSIDSIKFVQVVSSELKEDIKCVIEYLWKDEQTHFVENGKPQNHIFNTLRKLNEIMNV